MIVMKVCRHLNEEGSLNVGNEDLRNHLEPVSNQSMRKKRGRREHVLQEAGVQLSRERGTGRAYNCWC
jgi:hypothetical protein